MAVVFPQGLEVFANVASCVAAAGSGGTNGTSNPAAGTLETWTMSTGNTSFPAAQTSVVPNTYFYATDPADTTHEIVLVTDNTTTTSWHVQRGMNGATVAHASGATWVQVIAPYTLQGFKQTPGSVITPVTISNSVQTTNETVVASYTPQAADLVPGATWEIVAYGPFSHVNGSTTMTWNVYWGGSGSVGGNFNATGSNLLGMLKTGTNAVAPVTTLKAGASYDLNAQVTWISSTTAHCQINWWYTNTSNSLTGTNSNCQTTNTTTAGVSQVGPLTISGGGPIILTYTWATALATYSLTASAPFIYRQA